MPSQPSREGTVSSGVRRTNPRTFSNDRALFTLSFVRVALPLPVDQIYTYEVPVGLDNCAVRGTGVVVPFGKRVLTGVVVDVMEETDLKRTKSIVEVIDAEPVMTEEQLSLTRWIADYYLCSWGEAIRAALPPGITTRDDHGPRVSAREETRVRLGPEMPEAPLKGARQRAVLEALSGAGTDLSQAEILKSTGATSSTLRRLEDLGLLTRFKQTVDRSRGTVEDEAPVIIEQLHPEQAQALDRICATLREDTYATFLLHGVTGSGKTEVYIRALREARARNKSAIILVPEISLTPQTVRRFRSHFGDDIAVLHSRMGPGERFDAWSGIRAGRYPIVIGPRSAVFAPVRDLGLLIVDEEHEPSYKQFDPAPRYHARDVAVMRALGSGAVCILGSATPALESLSNARSGKYSLLEMRERIPIASGRAVLPKVRIIDMRSVKRSDSTLSPALRDAIQERISAKQQVILLQNRRGFAPYVLCSSCGWTLECEDCSVSMTYHKAHRHLRCHYCGRTSRLPRACPQCGAASLLQSGVGTQRVEDELHECLPDARVLRMDFDTTSQKDAHHRILDRFGRGEADILLGTQMVAKGLDFGRVTLVGVVDADTGLHFPDIRAEERTFQLLTQVAGRAGRADLEGEVILQTRNPGHRVIQFALRHDYKRFAESALPERELLGYPPFGRIIACLFSGPEENRVFSLSSRWATLARKTAPKLDILGPSPSFVGRVRRRFRTQVVIKMDPSQSATKTRAVIRKTNELFGSLPSGYRMSVDVDPVSIL